VKVEIKFLILNYEVIHYLINYILLIGFVEKRLQYRENEEMANWCRLHSKDRILDVDFALSYGVFDVCVESTKINSFNFVWNPNREASIFIKLNCISTEFTSKRHGGERGAPLRLIVDTYSQTTNAKFDCASCLVTIF
jgi:transcription factor CP2-like protein